MRPAARAALNAYGLSGVRLKFLRQAGNTLYQVNETNPSPLTRAELYTRGQYLLRIHQPDVQTAGVIELELAWLASMRQDAGLPVPEPVLTLDGNLLTRVSIPGIPVERLCHAPPPCLLFSQIGSPAGFSAVSPVSVRRRKERFAKHSAGKAPVLRSASLRNYPKINKNSSRISA
jgi:hypothetical protein